MADFTTVLAADCLEPDQIIYVADNTDARTTYPWRLVVEDEVMYVVGGVLAGEVLAINGTVSDGLSWSVRRGADDTDPAIHLAGTTVTGMRVGQYTTDEPLVEDDLTPTSVLTTEDESDWLRSDPETTGV
jgi:hypothetical protein